MRIKLSKAQWKTIGIKHGWIKQGSKLDFFALEDYARQLFPEADAMGIDKLINSVLKEVPESQEEAIAKLDQLPRH